MANVLYHDGCGVCLGIARTFATTPGMTVEIVDLGVDRHRAAEAQAAGVTRLPSLVIGGTVLRLEDHSDIGHVLAQSEAP